MSGGCSGGERDSRGSSGSRSSRDSSGSRDSRNSSAAGSPRILRPQVKWDDLYFYKKTVVLDQLTFVFCRRFLPKYGDRTVDQMVQAARSGKQNIVEGFADGVTSTEMELKLLNVACASLKELKEDYLDYLRRHSLARWDAQHPRYDRLLKFCREHNALADYQPFFARWTDEELANCAISLCHMVDKMMATFLEKKERDFTENGGIRERMTAARLGRRQTQNEEIAALKAEVERLRQENASLKRELAARAGGVGDPKAVREAKNPRQAQNERS